MSIPDVIRTRLCPASVLRYTPEAQVPAKTVPGAEGANAKVKTIVSCATGNSPRKDTAAVMRSTAGPRNSQWLLCGGKLRARSASRPQVRVILRHILA